MNEKNETPSSDDAANAALQVRAMLDMLLAGSVSDPTLYDGSLEDYAGAMLEKIGEVVDWFHRDTDEPAEAEETAGADMAGIARNIRMLAAQQRDPKVREDAERIASQIESEDTPHALTKELWRHGLTGIAPKAAEDSRRLGVNVFSKILARVATMNPEEVSKQLAAYQWDPLLNLAADPTEDEYSVSHSWSFRGMKFFLAQLEFMSWVEFGLREDGESEFTFPETW